MPAVVPKNRVEPRDATAVSEAPLSPKMVKQYIEIIRKRPSGNHPSQLGRPMQDVAELNAVRERLENIAAQPTEERPTPYKPSAFALCATKREKELIDRVWALVRDPDSVMNQALEPDVRLNDQWDLIDALVPRTPIADDRLMAASQLLRGHRTWAKAFFDEKYTSAEISNVDHFYTAGALHGDRLGLGVGTVLGATVSAAWDLGYSPISNISAMSSKSGFSLDAATKEYMRNVRQYCIDVSGTVFGGWSQQGDPDIPSFKAGTALRSKIKP